MYQIRFKEICYQLQPRPLLLFGLIVFVILERLTYYIFVLTPQPQPYKRDTTDPEKKEATCGCRVKSISRTWTEPPNAVLVVCACIATAVIYNTCLVDWPEILYVDTVIILVVCVVHWNGWGKRGKYHPIPATLLFTVITGGMIAAQSVYIGWFTGSTLSTASSILTIALCVDYVILLGLAIGAYLDEQHEWPPYIAWVERFFVFILFPFTVIFPAAVLVP